MEQNNKKEYASPWMRCTQIETEGTFASSVVDQKDKDYIEAQSQSYHEIDCGFEDEITWK